MIKRLLILLIIQALLTGCVTKQTEMQSASDRLNAERHAFELRCCEIIAPSEVVGRWSFSSYWSGHMGIALELVADGSFSYWFYSDVKSSDGPKYPIKGRWQLLEGVLILRTDSDEHLYATNWVLVQYGKYIGLMAPENINVLICHKATPDTRMLFRNRAPFEWPMLNMFVTAEIKEESLSNNEIQSAK